MIESVTVSVVGKAEFEERVVNTYDVDPESDEAKVILEACERIARAKLAQSSDPAGTLL